LQMAKKFGADHAINAKDFTPEKLKELNNGKLANRIIVSTGAISAIKQAMDLIERGGTILFFAPTDPGKKIEIP
ncbi:MAG: zinc-binding dehydrogenase, partial [Candidatus Aenigmarchaeota archaeon]|nr:zinc-binding dehydrogenase [Candidatus Aenigmarchaeota archaeon]